MKMATKAEQRAVLHGLIITLATVTAALVDLERAMHNRRVSPRSRQASPPMNDAMRRQIRALKAADPRLSQHVIAAKTGVNIGRVNETLIGVRK